MNQDASNQLQLPVPQAQWITDADALAQWLAPVQPGDVVGLDTEFTRRDTFYSRLALLQLAHHGRHALIDAQAFEFGTLLREHLGANGVVTVMHSAGEDLETLAPWLPAGPGQLFDTQIAAAFCGMGQSVGYASLVASLCDVELDKGETRSDWTRRPLSASQFRYATLDVVFLERLYQQLAARLEANGHGEWCAADCDTLKHRAHVDQWPEQPQYDQHLAAGWSAPEQARLRQLLLWRERTARKLDCPRGWLLDDAHALALVSDPPSSLDGLRQATRGVRALRAEQRQALWELLQRPLEPDQIAATHLVPARPAGAVRDAISAMRQALSELAGRLELPASLLCPRRYLEGLAHGQPWPTALSGWRKSLLEPVLEPLAAT